MFNVAGVENGSESAGEKNLQRKSGKKRPLNAESGDVHRCKQQCRKDRLQEMLPGFDISRMSKEEALCKFRKSKQMKVSGSDVPQPIYGFEDLQDCIGASPLLAKTLLSQGFKEPSSIQMQAIPALAKWRDVVGIAPTGSGKTLAFLVPIVTLLEQECAKKHEEGIKALILCPTKELAMQTTRVIRSVLAGMHSILQLALLGPTDLESIQQADIVLATPLKLTSLVEKQKLDLAHVRFLVLDEADRLFEREKIKSKKKSMENQPPKHEASDSVPLVNNAEETLDADSSEALSRRHFLNQIDTIISSCVHPELVRALFSATFPSHVEVLARNILQDPITITIGRLNSAVDSVKQHLVFVGSEKGKLLGLKQLLKSGLKPPILVFVDTKERVKVLRKELMQGGVKVDCIHSDQNPQARQAALDNFRIGHVWVLVSTDVLGRGIDFLGVKVVVNYDFPRSSMDYIHRIGRTGRAGRSGEYYSNSSLCIILLLICSIPCARS